jgi:hypothetical protein
MNTEIIRNIRYSLDVITLLLKIQNSLNSKLILYCDKEHPYRFLDIDTFILELKLTEKLTHPKINELKGLKDRLQQIFLSVDKCRKLPPENETIQSNIYMTLFYRLLASFDELIQITRIRKISGSNLYLGDIQVIGSGVNKEISVPVWDYMDAAEMGYEIEAFYNSGNYEKIDIQKFIEGCEKLLENITPYVVSFKRPFNNEYDDQQLKVISKFLKERNMIINSDSFCEIMNGERHELINWIGNQVELKTFIAYFCKKVSYIENDVINKYASTANKASISGELPFSEAKQVFVIDGKTMTKGSFNLKTKLFDKLFANLDSM